MSERGRVTDLSKLPASGFRSHGLWWWAGSAYMLMETAGFALACAAYVYLMNANSQWPLTDRPPDLFWGTAQTLVLLASLPPTLIMMRAARRFDRAKAVFWAVLVAGLNTLALVIRALELPHLNTRWDQDAYGSITWTLMLLHTVHLITDFVDTGFLVVFMFTHPLSGERLSDLDDDGIYWMFVVACWIPVYLLVYWAPRWAP